MVTALSVLAIALFAAAAVTDTLRRRIPNTLSAALALLGLARLGLALAAGGGAAAFGLDVLVTLLIFVLAALAFRYGLLGGGDVKLLAAGVLWLGAAALGPYLLTTVLAGGALAAAFVAWHVVAGRAGTNRPSLPYGVAIAAGGILTTAGALWP